MTLSPPRPGATEAWVTRRSLRATQFLRVQIEEEPA